MSKNKLENIDEIKKLEESGELDAFTTRKLAEIKNPIFKNNVFDMETKQLVSSICLIKYSKYEKKMTPIIWSYYRDRNRTDVNTVIKQHGRDKLIINYSIGSA